MKTIGIKLADGTFYSILKEGTVEKKQLNLTTVKDDQTTVQVDLYRSETESMDDAEYVDSLEIKNLIKHPNGQPDINLDISIDENNELHAELHDPETGSDSTTTVSLVSRTIEQLKENSDITLAELDESLFNTEVQESFDSDDDLTFDPNSLNVDSLVEESLPDTTENAKPVSKGGLLEAASAMTKTQDIILDDFIKNDNSPEEDNFEKNDITTEIADFPEDEFTIPETSEQVSDNITTDEEFSIPDNFEAEDFSFDEQTSEVNSQEEPNEEFTIPEPSDDFTLNETPLQENSSDETSTAEELNSDELNSSEFNSSEFTIPEIDDIDFADSENSPEEPLFNDFENTSAEPVSSGLDFSDILDDETKEGYAGKDTEAERFKKKTNVPVIICIICAIICILAVILTLFVIPSKLNIVKTNCQNENQTVAETSTSTKEKPTSEPQAQEQKYAAKENEIVVAPAEEIVPEVPKKTVTENKNISYKIKWGDTLWDISKSYYNNPWKYPKIAKFNGIKNPDHIISGTTIIIPAE